MIDNPEFGFTPKNLKGLMREYQLSQVRLAKLAQVSSARTVAKWLRGERDMPHERWKILIRNLCLSIKAEN